MSDVSKAQRRPVVDYNTCAYCERGAYFCRCAEPEVAKQMDAELEQVMAEIEAESRPAVDAMLEGGVAVATHTETEEPMVVMRRPVWDRLQADLARITAERDAMLEAVEAARAWVAVSGHNMSNWGECAADPPEACKWLALNDSLVRLDAQQQPHA